ncbi:hypothetical protein SASPL_107667 [Salvia splendens]|uniref:Secreted protein n=1 Tax=Salvia splendens TaxID=180675 RepID=A0A8X8YAS8_SALSN|nr:hypothetical protein SASPL_107667 [Salvia splendens]
MCITLFTLIIEFCRWRKAITEGCWTLLIVGRSARGGAACTLGRTCAIERVGRAAKGASVCHLALMETGRFVDLATPI